MNITKEKYISVCRRILDTACKLNDCIRELGEIKNEIGDNETLLKLLGDDAHVLERMETEMIEEFDKIEAFIW